MRPTKTKKRFDCIAFKREAQAEIYEEIKHLTPAQQIEYFNRHADKGPLSAWWKKIRGRSP